MNRLVLQEHIDNIIRRYKPRFSVSSVTVSEDSQATVQVSGEWPLFNLHFQLPKGKKGDSLPGLPGEGRWLNPQELTNPWQVKQRVEQELRNKGICFLPPGTYSLNAPIVLDDGQSLVGAGINGFSTNTILKPAPGYTGPLVESKDFGERCILRSHIRGIWFDGSDTTLTAIRLNCRESSIVDIMIRACYTYGVWIGGISSNASTGLALNNIVRDVKMFGSVNAKYWVGVMEDYYSADNRFINLYVEGCREACLESRGANALVHESHFYKCEQDGGSKAYGIVFRDSGEKYLTDCYIENMDGIGLYLAGSGASADIVVSNNIFRNVRRKTTTQLSGSDVVIGWETAPSNCVISGNVVRRDSSSFRQVSRFIDEAPGVVERDNVWTDAVANQTNVTLMLRRITGGQTLRAGRQYLYTGSNATLTLPSGTVGDVIELRRCVATGVQITLTPHSGQNIDSSSSSLTLTGKGITTLYYESVSVGWRTA